jgi:membrane-bound lytic murein transglycosylase A
MSPINASFLSALVAALLFGCATRAPIRKVNSPENVIGLSQSDSLQQAVRLTVRKLLAQQLNSSKTRKTDSVADISRCFASRWERIWTLQRLGALLQGHGATDLSYKDVINNFRFYAPTSWGRTQQTLVTGYYEPVLKGSLVYSERFRYPLYALPANEELRTLSRRKIDYENGLAGKGYEIAWLESDIERFFLHIQGSGVIELENGELLRVGYAGKNGEPYVPVGRVLVEMGVLELSEITMDSIKSALNSLSADGKQNELIEIMSQNGSYVYFEVRNQGATGSLGVELIPWGSFASDPEKVPLGTVGLVDLGGGVFGVMISQDTGGAIKGTQHIDVFTGRGESAGLQAGRMKDRRGVYYVARKECAEDDL